MHRLRLSTSLISVVTVGARNAFKPHKYTADYVTSSSKEYMPRFMHEGSSLALKSSLRANSSERKTAGLEASVLPYMPV